MGQVNRSGYFWDGLSKEEYGIIGRYMRDYVDSYSAEIIGELGSWEKLKRRMQGIAYMNIDDLKKGTRKVLAQLSKQSA